MTTYNTGNPIGSTAVKDLYDNAENLDVFVNDKSKLSHPDRLGQQRKTWHGMEQDFQQFLINSGYEQIGDYGPGLEITARNQVFAKDGDLYRAGASLPLPHTTTGDWNTEGSSFVAVGDGALRQDLIDDSGASLVGFSGGLKLSDLSASGANAGDAMIAVKQPFAGSVLRTQHAKNLDHVTTADVAAPVYPGDATAAFSALEASSANAIDLLGNKYSVSSINLTKQYYNGTLIKDGSQFYPPILELLSTQPTVGKQDIPTGFNNRLNAEVSYSDGKFKTGLRFEQVDWASGGAGSARYVSFSTGHDTNNDGLTKETPWKTLTKAFAASLSSNIVVHVLDQFTPREGGGHSASAPIAIGANLKIVAAHPSGEAIIGGFESRSALTWTASSGAFTAPRSQVNSIFDAKFRDENGLPRPLTLLESSALVSSTRGSWARSADGNTITVNLFDGRTPDAQCLVVLGVGAWTFSQPANGRLSLDGVKLIYSTGAMSTMRITSGVTPNTASLAAKNCAFIGGMFNGLEVVRTNTVLMDNCVSAYNVRDGFNYADGIVPSPMVVYEINNKGYQNRYSGVHFGGVPTGSDNGSSAHNGMSIMRVNCDYYDCGGGVVADVNGCFSVNYGVGAGESTGAEELKTSFYFNNTSNPSPKANYLIGCSGGSDNTFAISAPADVDVRVANWSGGFHLAGGAKIRDIDGQLI